MGITRSAVIKELSAGSDFDCPDTYVSAIATHMVQYAIKY